MSVNIPEPIPFGYALPFTVILISFISCGASESSQHFSPHTFMFGYIKDHTTATCSCDPVTFTKQRATRLGSEILKNPEDPVYPLAKEYSDVVSKHPSSQLPPDWGVRHEIDLVPDTKYCVTRQWPLPREQCEVIDAFVVKWI
ncbi:Pol protein [Phytophthora palmivora]|uniref:Pol protein n=1 Tax=Phytophthora palmivora TaxID=4796 RepID=A0A2P4XKP5_9STRA|nr:Pol protein [Phytophthora palmivora]